MYQTFTVRGFELCRLRLSEWPSPFVSAAVIVLCIGQLRKSLANRKLLMRLDHDYLVCARQGVLLSHHHRELPILAYAGPFHGASFAGDHISGGLDLKFWRLLALLPFCSPMRYLNIPLSACLDLLCLGCK